MAEEVVVDSQVSDVLALSESDVAKARQEGALDVLSKPDELKRFTLLKRKQPVEYAKILYIHADIDAIEKWEKEGGDYVPPQMSRMLVEPDLHLKVSSDALLIKVVKSISHLVESAPSGGRVGFFGRRKG